MPDDIIEKLKKEYGIGRKTSSANTGDDSLRAEAIKRGAAALEIDPVDYATAISYESGGSFDPWKAGPVTKWGQHRGTIQYGEPQRKKYGVHEQQTFEDQVTNSNVRYLKDAGVKPGMKFAQIYAAINGGNVNKDLNTPDADTGRTIADNIRIAEQQHRPAVLKRFGTYFGNNTTTQAPTFDYEAAMAKVLGKPLPNSPGPTFKGKSPDLAPEIPEDDGEVIKVDSLPANMNVGSVTGAPVPAPPGSDIRPQGGMLRRKGQRTVAPSVEQPAVTPVQSQQRPAVQAVQPDQPVATTPQPVQPLSQPAQQQQARPWDPATPEEDTIERSRGTFVAEVDPDFEPSAADKNESVFRQAIRQWGQAGRQEGLNKLQEDALVEYQRAKKGGFVFSDDTDTPREAGKGPYTITEEDTADFDRYLQYHEADFSAARADNLREFLAAGGDLNNEARARFKELGMRDDDIDRMIGFNPFTGVYSPSPFMEDVEGRKREYQKLVDTYSKAPDEDTRMNALTYARRAMGWITPRQAADEIADFYKLKSDKRREMGGTDENATTAERQIAGAFRTGMSPEAEKQIDAERQANLQNYLRQTIGKYGTATNKYEVDRQEALAEAARKNRIAQMSWPEYIGRTVTDGTLNIAKSAVSVALSGTLRGIALTAKQLDRLTGNRDFITGERRPDKVSDYATYKAADSIDAFLDVIMPTNKDMQGEFLAGKLPQGFGSTLGMAIGGVSKTPRLAIAALSSLQMGGDAYKEAIQGGASEAEAQTYGLLSAPLGITEIFGIGEAINRLNKGTGGSVWKTLFREAYNAGKREAPEELLQEGSQTVSQNIIARLTYDPDRKADKDLYDNLLVAGISAPLASSGVSILNVARNRHAIKQMIEQEQANGVIIKSFGDGELYVFDQKVPVTPELAPMVERYNFSRNGIMAVQAEIKAVQEAGKHAQTPEQTAPYLQKIWELKKELTALQTRQVQISKDIADAAGVPPPEGTVGDALIPPVDEAAGLTPNPEMPVIQEVGADVPEAANQTQEYNFGDIGTIPVGQVNIDPAVPPTQRPVDTQPNETNTEIQPQPSQMGQEPLVQDQPDQMPDANAAPVAPKIKSIKKVPKSDSIGKKGTPHNGRAIADYNVTYEDGTSEQITGTSREGVRNTIDGRTGVPRGPRPPIVAQGIKLEDKGGKAADEQLELATKAVAPLGLPEGLAERVINRLTTAAERDGRTVGEEDATPELVRHTIIKDLDGYRRNDLREVLRPFIDRVNADGFDVIKEGGKVWSDAQDAIKKSDEQHEKTKDSSNEDEKPAQAETPETEDLNDGKKGEQDSAVVPPDDWRNHLIKARSYANDLGLPDDIKDAHWTDAEGLTKAIDQHLEAANKPAETKATEDKPSDTEPAKTKSDKDEADDLFEQAFGQKYGKPETVETPEEVKEPETTTTGPLEINGGTEEIQRNGNDLIHTTTLDGGDPIVQTVAQDMKLPKGMRYVDLDEASQRGIRKAIGAADIEADALIFAVDDKNKVAFAYNPTIPTSEGPFVSAFPTAKGREIAQHLKFEGMLLKYNNLADTLKSLEQTEKPDQKKAATPKPKVTATPEQNDALTNLAAAFGFEIPEAPKVEGPQLEDFGQKIGGARKDMWADRGMTFADVAAMIPREREKLVRKDQIWPKPDYMEIYERFLEKGFTQEEAATDSYLVKMVYDGIDQPPIKKWTRYGEEVSDEKWQKYISFVEKVRNAMSEALGAATDSKWADAFKEALTTQDGSWRSIDTTFADRVLSDPSGYRYTAERKAKSLGFPSKRELWMREYKVVDGNTFKVEKQGTLSRGDKWYIQAPNTWTWAMEFDSEEEAKATADALKGGFSLLDNRGKILQSFATASAAADAARKRYADAHKRPTGEPTRPMLQGIKRGGVDYLKGKPAKPELFVETFGFRGVEFGNWLSKEDRQQSLDHAYNALMDLANVLHISPQALSLSGKLSLAFGSRGRKGALAHYEPSRIVINLTKMSGAGSLAHEWAHALDDYFGSQAMNAAYAEGRHQGYASEMSGRAGLRHEMQRAWAGVVSRIIERNATNEETVADALASLNNSRHNTFSWVKSVFYPIRHTEQFETALDTLKKDFDSDMRSVDAFNKFVAELTPLQKLKAKDIKILDERRYWLNRGQVQLERAVAGEIVKKTPTDYITHAKNLDKMFKSKPYWSTVLEMFARAFESYVQDRTDSKSQYLVHGTDTPVREYTGKGNKTLPASPYPQGSEREAINAAFDNFFDVIEQETDDGGIVSLKSVIAADESDNHAEERYQAIIKPALADAFKAYAFEHDTPIEAMMNLLNALESRGFTEEQIRQMKPDITRFARENFLQKPKEESIDKVDDERTDINQDSEDGDGGSGTGDVQGTPSDEDTGSDDQRSSERGDGDVSSDVSDGTESSSDNEKTGSDSGQGGVSTGTRGSRSGNQSGNGVSAESDAGNYVAPDGSLTRKGSWRDAANNNLDAIELAKKIEDEGRRATLAEQETLAKFVGWGAGELANNVFKDPNGYSIKPAWKEVATRLRSLMTPEELSTAERSTQYAHYTSEKIVRGIWSAVQQFGFKDGSILEPGMGIGLFPIAAPKELIEKSAYTGIEMDAMTARIAKLLLPEKAVLETDFIKQTLPDNHFDVAIGNPPFLRTTILADPKYKKNRFLLHDYFFAKSLDAVRPGGLLVFVTSKGTMDKARDAARKYMADKADLLGAIRLPQTAFKDNAGTDVVTDVLFFRKRMDGEEPSGEKWLGHSEVTAKNKWDEDHTGAINEYFVNHPEMVLGEHSFTGTMRHGDNEYTVIPKDGDIEEQFQEAIKNLPTGVFAKQAKSQEIINDTADRDWDPKAKKEGSLYVHDDGRLMRREGGSGVEVKLTDKETKWLKDYVGLRDALKQAQFDQLHAEDEGQTIDWEKSLKDLNAVYDAFVKKHGNILEYTDRERTKTDDDGNETVTVSRTFKNDKLLFGKDIESPLVWSLERITDDGDIVKSKWLQERIIKPPEPPKIENIKDALMVSLDKTGSLNIGHIVQLMEPVKPTTESEVIETLGDLIYEAPGGGWQMADEYLSGNVKDKLEAAEVAAADPRYRRNVEALRKVQPLPLPPEKITIQIGATWVPVEHVNEFAREVLGMTGQYDRASSMTRPIVEFDSVTNTWTVPGAHGTGSQSKRAASAEWGTSDRSPEEILEAALNSQTITITKTDPGPPSRKYMDKDAMAQVQQIIEKMNNAFGPWLFEDTDRQNELVDYYNRKLNVIAKREFNGEHLTTPGLSFRYELYPHQKRAVWRIIQTGNTYLAHAVGAGKTLEMIVSAMEQKRLGKISKPMFAVPRHMLEQFASDFLSAYPLANIMVADEQNFHTDNRRKFIAQAALNDLDAIIIPHSSFGLLRTTEESSRIVLDDLLSEMRDAMEALTTGYNAKGEPKGDTLQDTATIKRIQQRIEAIEQKFFGRMNSARDNVIDFEEMGVDFLYVDEAHEFRKLDFTTNQSNLKGVDAMGSMRALDLLVKARWLDRKRPGRSLVLASGTPLTNTMAELYTIQRFLGHRKLIGDGLDHFDGWARQYGKVEENIEPNAAGQYQPVKRFQKFINTGILMQGVQQFMDILTLKQMVEEGVVKVPTIKGGKPQIVVGEPPAALVEYKQGELSARIEASKKWKPSPPDEMFNPDPMIAIISDAQLAGFDMRFIDPNLPNDPTSKLNLMIDGIIDSYHAHNDIEYVNPETKEPYPIKGAAHIAFTYGGIGEGVIQNRGFDSKAWIRKRLIEGGIPNNEIAFMSDYGKTSQKEAMFREMREGKKKILIATPKNAGTGVNVQLRLKTLHYGMAPWFPADVEQPDGRIVRQGNQNKEVELTRYAIRATYDESQWAMLSRKSRNVEDVLMGTYDGDVEDLSESSQYAMASALVSGDPRAIRVATLRGQIEKYTRLEQGYHSTQSRLQYQIRDLDSTWGGIPAVEKSIKDLNEAIAAAPDEPVSKETFSITIGKDTFNKDSKTKDAEGKSKDVNNADIGKSLKKAWRDQIAKNKKKAIDLSGKDVPFTLATVMGKFPINGVVWVGNEGQIFSNLSIDIGPITVRLNDSQFGTNERLIESDVSDSGLVTRIYNAFNGLKDRKTQGELTLADKQQEKAKAEAALARPFEHGDELSAARSELNQLQKEMVSDGVEPPSDTLTAQDIQVIQDAYQPNLISGSREDVEYEPIEPLSSREVEALDEAYDLVQLQRGGQKSVLPQDEIAETQNAKATVFRNPNLTATEKSVEDKTIAEVTANPERYIKNYIDKFGGRIVNADLAKELFPEYLKNRLTNDKAVHAAASVVARMVFDTRLAELPKGSDVVLTAGGQASGKTSIIQANSADLVYDSVMSNVEGNRAVIDKIINAGHRGTIDYVFRAVEPASVAMIRRLNKEGRPVSVRGIATGHFGSQQAFIKDTDAYARSKGFNVYYVETRENQASRAMDFEEFKNKVYDNYEDVLTKVRGALTNELKNYEYSKEIRQYFEPQLNPRGVWDTPVGGSDSGIIQGEDSAASTSEGNSQQSLKSGIESDPNAFLHGERPLSSPLNEDSAKDSERMTIEEMRDQPYRDIENIVDEADFAVVGGKIRLNIQAHELLRRAQEQNRLETKQKAGKRPSATDVEDLFGGEFLEPEPLQRNIEILRAKAEEARGLGYDAEFVSKLTKAADALEKAGKEGGGTVVAYILDSALPHELFHQVDYINAVDKSLLNRHTDKYKAPLDNHAVAKILWTKHFSKFNEYTRYKQQTHLNGRLRSEIPPLLLELSDEKLSAMGITPEMKADYLRIWFEGYAAKNGVDSLDQFAEENLNVETYINQAKEAFQGQSNVGGTGEEGQTVDSGQVSQRQGEKPPDGGGNNGSNADGTGGVRLTAETHMGRRIEKREIEKELGFGDDTRLRSLPLTLRRAGIEALDLAYEVFHDGPAIEAATDLLEKHGMEGSIDLLRNMPAKELDAEHGILSFMLMRTLQNHAVSVRDSDPETARKHFELSLELGREHAIMATQLGRFTRVPSIVGPSVETLKYAIQGIVEAREKGMNKTLTPEQWENIEGLGRNLEDALTQIDALRRDKINLQAQNRRLKDEQAGKRRRRTASGQKNRQKLVDLIQEDKERVQGVENARARLRAKFNTDAADVSESDSTSQKSVLPSDNGILDLETLAAKDPESLNDFSEVGAMMLTEGLAGEEDYLPSDFKAEMISEFGTSIEPYFDEIYKAAWDKRTEWLNDTRAKETKERIENKYNQGQELEDWQIAEIVGEEKANAKRRRFIERYHEITAGGTKKPRNLDAYKAIIADLTQDLDDTVTLGALVHAEGLGIAAIHKRLTAFGITEDSEQRRALREGSKIFEQAKKIHRSQQEEIANEILRNDGNLKEIDELMWEARNKLRVSQQAVADEMRRIKNGEGWYRLSQLANGLNASRTIMASFDMSGALRQGGFFTFAKPEMQKKAFVNMWNSIREKGYGAAIMEIEKTANFTLSQRSGIDYAVAGKTDEGSLMGEELFKGEKTIEHLPVVGKLLAEGIVKWSERTYTAFLDTQRMVMFDVFAKDLMSQGLTFQSHPQEFKKIAAFINIATGRGVMPSNKYAKLIMDLPLFAPRYTLSRLQLLNMTLNPVAYYNMPPAARKIIAGQAVRFYGTTMGILGLVTAFGSAVGASVNWDDDDSDFLKIKIGNTYYDIFAGNLQAAKLIIKVVHSAIRTKGGFENRLHGELLYDVIKDLGHFGRGKLSPGPSLIVDWLSEKDYVGNDFTWTKGIVSRLMPLTLSDMYQAWELDGVVGIAKSTPFTFLGVGVANYKQRPEMPNTEAEKFAGKAAAWSFKGVSKLDKQQKELKDSLVWRSRMGEDVSAEVDAAVKAGIFSPNHKREILSAAKKTYLQVKAEGLSLDDMETVLKVATASERQELLPLVSEKMKNADVDGKLSPAQRGRLEQYGASVLGNFPMPDAVRDEFDMLNMKTPDVGESLTVKKGEKRELSTGQYDKYRRETLERVYKEVEELLQKQSYQQADAEEKRKQLRKAIAKGRRAEQKDTKREMRRELVP